MHENANVNQTTHHNHQEVYSLLQCRFQPPSIRRSMKHEDKICCDLDNSSSHSIDDTIQLPCCNSGNLHVLVFHP